MSHLGQTTPASLTEGSPVTNLTVVVLLLIPCVVILLLLNCLFLAYKLLVLTRRSRRNHRGDAEEMLLQRIGAFSPLQDGRTVYMSLSEPVLSHPVTSSRASSRDRAGVNPRFRQLRPDGATGSGSLRAPSTIRAAPSSVGRLEVPPCPLRTHKTGWWRSAPNLMQSSGSETGLNLVPPNSPMQEPERVSPIRRSSTHEKLTDVNLSDPVHPFDKLVMDCEYANLPSDTSAAASGLDSDFGASAGVSLRILSADSDGLSNGILSSALEWDYYDPCYVKQNNIPKHTHHRAIMHTKQYWV
uniref:Si:dkey-121h17.7 n=2 Tax=Iconisemion striatum TaxID=60296 RepID=A0A1A7X0F6_9TELE